MSAAAPRCGHRRGWRWSTRRSSLRSTLATSCSFTPARRSRSCGKTRHDRVPVPLPRGRSGGSGEPARRSGRLGTRQVCRRASSSNETPSTASALGSSRWPRRWPTASPRAAGCSRSATVGAPPMRHRSPRCSRRRLREVRFRRAPRRRLGGAHRAGQRCRLRTRLLTAADRLRRRRRHRHRPVDERQLAKSPRRIHGGARRAAC